MRRSFPTPFLLHDRLRDVAAACPDLVAVISESKSHTYRELLETSTQFARCLQDAGVKRGDRVVLQLENTWDCACAIYGTFLAGCVVTAVSVQTLPGKVAFILEDCDARAFVAEARLVEALHEQEGVPSGVRLLLARGRVPESASAVALDVAIASAEPSIREVDSIPVDLAALIYTSGSTGTPKGVMVTHANMTFTAESISRYLELTTADRLHGFLPLAYGYGLYQLVGAVHVAATVVLERSFAFPAHVAERALEEKVTVFAGVPTVFAGLLAVARRTGLQLPEVRCVTNAAAAMPAEYVPALAELFPRARIYLMYGLTECQRVCFLDPALTLEKPLSVGRAMPGTETIVLDDQGEQVEPGEVGILHVRGPHVMRGYWGRQDLTDEMLVDGPTPGETMLCTQDRFTVDEEGLLYFRGRGSDMLNVGGQKVSPFEVENALRALDGIYDVAVVGMPDAVLGETVVAFVVREGDAALDEQDIRRRCRGKLEGVMVPSRIEFIDELPTTPSGKVAKSELRQ